MLNGTIGSEVKSDKKIIIIINMTYFFFHFLNYFPIVPDDVISVSARHQQGPDLQSVVNNRPTS